jgi:hypothetical protein
VSDIFFYLHTLKHIRAILKTGTHWIKRQRTIRFDFWRAPANLWIIVHNQHVIRFCLKKLIRKVGSYKLKSMYHAKYVRFGVWYWFQGIR